MAEIDKQTIQEIARGMYSRYPLIYLQGWEEARIAAALRQLSAGYFKDERPLWTWSAAQGLSDGAKIVADTRDPLKALDHVRDTDEEALYLFRDLPGEFDRDGTVVRALRDLYQTLGKGRTHLFLSHPQLKIPEILKREIYLVRLPRASENEIYEHVGALLKQDKNLVGVDDDAIFRLAYALNGLSIDQVSHFIARLAHEKIQEPEAMIAEAYREKGKELAKESCLRLIPQAEGLDHIGGLENLKAWVEARKALFTREAMQAGAPLPSGILFMGVSGCGKSLACKVIAGAWDLMLVRLDMNLVMSGAYGSPEYAFEHAVTMAEELAPMVLWIDEVENSFGYDTSHDGGTNTNIFASFLTWMQEKPPTVFVAATANRIQKLPAELIRKGRFDQVFFLDLPSEAERGEIFRIHVEANGVQLEPNEYTTLAKVTKGWSGAEIAQVVKSARVEAYQEEREFNRWDIINSAGSFVPLSQTMDEQIRELKTWSFGRATPASGKLPESQ